MKVLFITKAFNQIHNDGGAVVTKRNYDLLRSVFGKGSVKLFEIPTPSNWIKLFGMLFQNDYGVTKKIEKEIKKEINDSDYIIFNSSLYGNLIKYCAQIKKKNCVFFHNIEKNYYHDMYKYNKNVISFLFYKYITKIEFRSCFYSQCRIVLNKRDENEMHKIYSMRANLILPISMESKPMNTNKTINNACGFIGSDFFANREGVEWFIQNVAPYVNKEIIIAGSICNFLKDKLMNSKNVKLLGYVDNLYDFYNRVDFIVSPIFHGSGMKTKSIEALSYNLPILGTKEAFVGIENYNEIGLLCEDKESFIRAINTFDLSLYNDKPYLYFEENFSDLIVQKKFSELIFSL